MHDAAKKGRSPAFTHLEPDTFLEEYDQNADRLFYFDEGPRATDEAYFESLSKSAEEPDNSLEAL